jgi:hypothetical protein
MISICRTHFDQGQQLALRIGKTAPGTAQVRAGIVSGQPIPADQRPRTPASCYAALNKHLAAEMVDAVRHDEIPDRRLSIATELQQDPRHILE